MKKGKAQQRKRAPQRRSSNQQRQPQVGTLSHCAMLYATAIARPFEVGEGVCIPSGSGPSRPSQKVRTIGRFVASTGDLGFGFALIMPSLANDSTCALFSNASYSSTVASPFGLPLGEYSSIVLSSLPYGKTLFTSGSEFTTSSLHGRIVSYGVRWRYIGSELKKSGRSYALVHPDHENLYGCSFNSLGNYKECLTTACTRSWTEMVVFSNCSSEVDYPTNNVNVNNTVATPAAQEELLECYPISSQQFLSSSSVPSYTSGTVVGGAPLAVVFDGEKGNQYEFEIVAHVEYVGTITQSMLTKSHADPVGFSVVQEAANGLGLARRYATNQATAMLRGIASAAASQTGSLVKTAATQYATKALTQAARGSMLALMA